MGPYRARVYHRYASSRTKRIDKRAEVPGRGTTSCAALLNSGELLDEASAIQRGNLTSVGLNGTSAPGGIINNSTGGAAESSGFASTTWGCNAFPVPDRMDHFWIILAINIVIMLPVKYVLVSNFTFGGSPMLEPHWRQATIGAGFTATEVIVAWMEAAYRLVTRPVDAATSVSATTKMAFNKMGMVLGQCGLHRALSCALGYVGVAWLVMPSPRKIRPHGEVVRDLRSLAAGRGQERGRGRGGGGARRGGGAGGAGEGVERSATAPAEAADLVDLLAAAAADLHDNPPTAVELVGSDAPAASEGTGSSAGAGGGFESKRRFTRTKTFGLGRIERARKMLRSYAALTRRCEDMRLLNSGEFETVMRVAALLLPPEPAGASLARDAADAIVATVYTRPWTAPIAARALRETGAMWALRIRAFDSEPDAAAADALAALIEVLSSDVLSLQDARATPIGFSRDLMWATGSMSIKLLASHHAATVLRRPSSSPSSAAAGAAADDVKVCLIPAGAADVSEDGAEADAVRNRLLVSPDERMVGDEPYIKLYAVSDEI